MRFLCARHFIDFVYSASQQTCGVSTTVFEDLNTEKRKQKVIYCSQGSTALTSRLALAHMLESLTSASSI